MRYGGDQFPELSAQHLLFAKPREKGTMSRFRAPSLFPLLMSMAYTALLGCSAPILTIPRESIPLGVPASIRREIERLYSKHPIERAYGAYYLGGFGAEAAPAIPFLIETLGDTSPLRWVPVGASRPVLRGYRVTWEVPHGVGIPTSPGEEAAKALKKITGEDFGRSTEAWREWLKWKNIRDPSLI